MLVYTTKFEKKKNAVKAGIYYGRIKEYRKDSLLTYHNISSSPPPLAITISPASSSLLMMFMIFC